MQETHTQTFYVIEVAPNIFLECYSEESAYCADNKIYFRRCDKDSWNADKYKNDRLWRYNVATFKSPQEARAYILKRGTEKDFLEWCGSLKEKYGGDGKPKIRKVTETLTADIAEGKDLF